MKHTSGPWGAFEDENCWGVYSGDWESEDSEELAQEIYNEADARLMAAAPDLLTALVQVLNHFAPMRSSLKIEQDVINAADAAINKALGGSK